MKSLTRKVLQAASGAVVLAGGLFLGSVREPAAQVFAGFCSASEQSYCNQYCMSLYPQGAISRCIKYSSGAVNCNCQPF
jgi:hypothetical protein